MFDSGVVGLIYDTSGIPVRILWAELWAAKVGKNDLFSKNRAHAQGRRSGFGIIWLYTLGHVLLGYMSTEAWGCQGAW